MLNKTNVNTNKIIDANTVDNDVNTVCNIQRAVSPWTQVGERHIRLNLTPDADTLLKKKLKQSSIVEWNELSQVGTIDANDL